MKAVKKSATRTAARTLDGRRRIYRGGGNGRGGGKESKVGRKSVSTLREREGGRTRAAMGHRGGVGRLTG